MEDRLPTETFPPDFTELLFPFEAEDLELERLTVLVGFEVLLDLDAEPLELELDRVVELGFTALVPEREVLLLVVGFCAVLLLVVEVGFTVLALELDVLVCVARPLDCGFTLLLLVEDGLRVVAALEVVERLEVLVALAFGLLSCVFTAERFVVLIDAGFAAFVLLV